MLLFVSNKDMKYFLSYGVVLFVQVLFVLVILRPVLFVRTPHFMWGVKSGATPDTGEIIYSFANAFEEK